MELLKLLTLFMLTIGIMVTTVSPTVASSSTDLFTTLDASVGLYNNNVDQVPGLVKYLLGNEETYVTVDMDNGEKLEVKMVMKDAKIVQFEKIIGYDKSATISVATTEKMVKELMTSNNPIDTFMKAMDEGAIKVDGAGIYMYAVIKSLGVLMGIAKLIGSIVGMFKSIF